MELWIVNSTIPNLQKLRTDCLGDPLSISSSLSQHYLTRQTSPKHTQELVLGRNISSPIFGGGLKKVARGGRRGGMDFKINNRKSFVVLNSLVFDKAQPERISLPREQFDFIVHLFIS